MNAAKARKRVRIWNTVLVATFVVAVPLAWIKFPVDFIAVGLCGAALRNAAYWEGWIKGHEATRQAESVQR